MSIYKKVTIDKKKILRDIRACFNQYFIFVLPALAFCLLLLPPAQK